MFNRLTIISFFLILGCVAQIAASTFDKGYDLLIKARSCELVKNDDGSIQLCTGLTLTNGQLNEFKTWTLNSCQKEIQSLGYKILNAKDKNFNPPQSFMNSTQRAVVSYPLKTVWFKRDVEKEDCVHEYLHILQQLQKGELAPLNREKLANQIIEKLEEKIVELEKLEKSNQKDKAQELGKKLQLYVNLAKELRQIRSWLDEIEIYLLFYQHGSLFNISSQSYDIAFVNLLKFQKYLRWELRDELLSKAAILEQERNSYVISPKNKKVLTKREKLEFSLREKRVKSLLLLEKEGLEQNNLYQSLKAQALLGKLDKDLSQNTDRSKIFSFNRKNGFYMLDGYKKNIVLDLGAMDSIVPPHFFNKNKRSDFLLIGKKRIRLTDGTETVYPLVRYIGKNLSTIPNLSTFLLGDIPFKGIDVLIGLKEFQKGTWRLDLRNNKISMISDFSKGIKAKLQDSKALEFQCPEGRGVFRIDTGSEVMIDISRKNIYSQDYYGLLSEKNSICNIVNKYNGDVHVWHEDNVLFDRGVWGNLGIPWIKRFKYIEFNLADRVVNFK